MLYIKPSRKTLLLLLDSLREIELLLQDVELAGTIFSPGPKSLVELKKEQATTVRLICSHWPVREEGVNTLLCLYKRRLNRQEVSVQ
jgi:hypothetical protein